MKKIVVAHLVVMMFVCGGTRAFANARDNSIHVVETNVTSWGNMSGYINYDKSGNKRNSDGDYLNIDTLDKAVDVGFVVSHKDAVLNKQKETDKIVALVAKNISGNGGEFIPMTLECDQGNGGRWGGWTRYYSDAESGMWLCADGYMGNGCTADADTAKEVVDYAYFHDANRRAVEISTNNEITASVPVLKDYYWHYAGDKREGNIVLALVEYTPSGHGAFAAPVNIRCTGTRYAKDDGYDGGKGLFNASTSFDGKFKKFTIPRNGKKRLVCAMGYRPNASGTDCTEVVNTAIDSTKPKTTVQDVDGSYMTYSETNDLDGVAIQKSRPGYDEAEHSVHKFEDGSRYAIFCRDESKGLESDATLKCVDCTTGMRSGVCKQDKDGFGFCSRCGTGYIYDTTECRCVAAMAYTMTDLAHGWGNNPSTSASCWAKEDDQEYRDCVINQQKRGTNDTNDTSGRGTDTTTTLTTPYTPKVIGEKILPELELLPKPEKQTGGSSGGNSGTPNGDSGTSGSGSGTSYGNSGTSSGGSGTSAADIETTREQEENVNDSKTLDKGGKFNRPSQLEVIL